MILEVLQLAAALSPSFDCARARSQVEHAICSSAELAELDREEARIYGIARRLPGADRQGLQKRQRDFLRLRDECVESAGQLTECLRDAYLADIGELRRVSGLADDNEGLSTGPHRFACDGGYPDVYVTLFATDPGQGNISVPELNEGQPLVADTAEPRWLVGRYADHMVYDKDARVVRLGTVTCTAPG